ncbi:hypothetical protein BKA63DRAFT_567170 [Paraphoma chrysanthemicola]|nr:hypothetical protein BKA63DRAFT_567170 [Paraphoma chrysanthemicola]
MAIGYTAFTIAEIAPHYLWNYSTAASKVQNLKPHSSNLWNYSADPADALIRDAVNKTLTKAGFGKAFVSLTDRAKSFIKGESSANDQPRAEADPDSVEPQPFHGGGLFFSSLTAHSTSSLKEAPNESVTSPNEEVEPIDAEEHTLSHESGNFFSSLADPATCTLTKASKDEARGVAETPGTTPVEDDSPIPDSGGIFSSLASRATSMFKKASQEAVEDVLEDAQSPQDGEQSSSSDSRNVFPSISIFGRGTSIFSNVPEAEAEPVPAVGQPIQEKTHYSVFSLGNVFTSIADRVTSIFKTEPADGAVADYEESGSWHDTPRMEEDPEVPVSQSRWQLFKDVCARIDAFISTLVWTAMMAGFCVYVAHQITPALLPIMQIAINPFPDFLNILMGGQFLAHFMAPIRAFAAWYRNVAFPPGFEWWHITNNFLILAMLLGTLLYYTIRPISAALEYLGENFSRITADAEQAVRTAEARAEAAQIWSLIKLKAAHDYNELIMWLTNYVREGWYCLRLYAKATHHILRRGALPFIRRYIREACLPCYIGQVRDILMRCTQFITFLVVFFACNLYPGMLAIFSVVSPIWTLSLYLGDVCMKALDALVSIKDYTTLKAAGKATGRQAREFMVSSARVISSAASASIKFCGISRTCHTGWCSCQQSLWRAPLIFTLTAFPTLIFILAYRSWPHMFVRSIFLALSSIALVYMISFIPFVGGLQCTQDVVVALATIALLWLIYLLSAVARATLAAIDYYWNKPDGGLGALGEAVFPRTRPAPSRPNVQPSQDQPGAPPVQPESNSSRFDINVDDFISEDKRDESRTEPHDETSDTPEDLRPDPQEAPPHPSTSSRTPNWLDRFLALFVGLEDRTHAAPKNIWEDDHDAPGSARTQQTSDPAPSFEAQMAEAERLRQAAKSQYKKHGGIASKGPSRTDDSYQVQKRRDAEIRNAREAANERALTAQAELYAAAESKAKAKPVPKPSPKAYPDKMFNIIGKKMKPVVSISEKENIEAVKQNKKREEDEKKEAKRRSAHQEQIKRAEWNSEMDRKAIENEILIHQLKGEVGESPSTRGSDVSEKSETELSAKQAVSPHPRASHFKPSTLVLPSANNQSNTISEAPSPSEVTPPLASSIEQPSPSQPTFQPAMGNILSIGRRTPTPLQAPKLTTAAGGDSQPASSGSDSDKEETKPKVPESKTPESKEPEPKNSDPTKTGPKMAEPEKSGPKKAATKAGRKTGSLLSFDSEEYLGTNASDDEMSEPNDRGLKKPGSGKPEHKNAADPKTPAETATQRKSTEPTKPKLTEPQEKKPGSGFTYKPSDSLDIDLSAPKSESEMSTLRKPVAKKQESQNPGSNEVANKTPERQKAVKTPDWKSSQSSSNDQSSVDGPLKIPPKQQVSKKSETPGQSQNSLAHTNETTATNTSQPRATSQPSTTTQSPQAQKPHDGEQAATSTTQSEAAPQSTTKTSQATSIPQLPSITQADLNFFLTNREPLNLNDFPLPDLYTRSAGRPATGMDSKEQMRNRLLSGPSTLTQMRREIEAASRGVTDSGSGGGRGADGLSSHTPLAPGPFGGAAEPKNSGDDDDDTSKPNSGGAPISAGGNASHRDPAVEQSITPKNADDAIDIDTASRSSQPAISLGSKQVADILANPGIAALLRNQSASNATLVNTSGKEDEMEIDDGNTTPAAQPSAHANISTAATPNGDIDMQGTENNTNVQARTPIPPAQKTLPPLQPQTLDFTPLPVNSNASNPPPAAVEPGGFQPKTPIFGQTSTLGLAPTVSKQTPSFKVDTGVPSFLSPTQTSRNPSPSAFRPCHFPGNTEASPFFSQTAAPSPSSSFSLTAGRQQPATAQPPRSNAPPSIQKNLAGDRSTNSVGHRSHEGAYQSILADQKSKAARQAALPKSAVTPSIPSRTPHSSTTNNLSDILENIKTMSLEESPSRPPGGSQTTPNKPLEFTRAQEGLAEPYEKKDTGFDYAPTLSETVPKSSPSLLVSGTTAPSTPALGATAHSTPMQSMRSQEIPQYGTYPQGSSSQGVPAPSRPASIALSSRTPAQEPVRDDQLIDQKKGRRQQKQPAQTVLDKIIAQTISPINPVYRPPPLLAPPPRGAADRASNAMEGVQYIPSNTPPVQASKLQAFSVQAPPMQDPSTPAPPPQASPMQAFSTQAPPPQTHFVQQPTQREEVSPAQQSAAEPPFTTGSSGANPLENYPTYSGSSSETSELSPVPSDLEDVSMDDLKTDTNPRKNQATNNSLAKGEGNDNDADMEDGDDYDDDSDSSEASKRLRLGLEAANIGTNNFKSNEFVTAEDDASDDECEEPASQQEKAALEEGEKEVEGHGETRRRPDEERRVGDLMKRDGLARPKIYPKVPQPGPQKKS